MLKREAGLICYTAAVHNLSLDPFLERFGFTRGLTIFAIPAYGILFRCRAQGSLIDLEFAALFGLLRFVKSRLTKARISVLSIHSSNPEFVFCFGGNSPLLAPDSERRRLLAEHTRRIQLSVGLVERSKNKAWIPASDYPSLVDPASIGFDRDGEDEKKPSFLPFQTGIAL